MNVIDRFSMKGKAGVVTGAAQGLGQAMAGSARVGGGRIS